jgi:hypothetical protein
VEITGRGDANVDARAFQNVPIHKFIEESRVKAAKMAGDLATSIELTDEIRAKIRAQLPEYEKSKPGVPRATEKLLQVVAESYRAAVAERHPAPRKAVRAEVELFLGHKRADSTIARDIWRCRKVGLLGPAEERRAGELPKEES